MTNNNTSDRPETLHVFEVDDEAGTTRLDVFVAARLPHHSRSRWGQWIGEGRVLVDGASVKASSKVRPGERVEVREPAPAPAGIEPQDLLIDVLFEDDALLVVNKAPGMVVHPSAGHPDGTLVNALVFRVPDLAIGGEERPGIVHRLDRDTSGVIVCAKHDAAHRALSDAFRDRAVDKRYRAFALGRLRHEQRLVTGHVRDEKDRRRYTTKLPPPEEEGGNVRRAESHVRPVRYGGGVTDIEVQLLTGRTHQIRAHLADIGHPICEDPIYGGARSPTRVVEGPVRQALSKLTRTALHAEQLGFAHPITGEAMHFVAPLPDDLAALAAAIAAVQV
jgi:23S rRNA pseudouridine1911/1915/1917 synthase